MHQDGVTPAAVGTESSPSLTEQRVPLLRTKLRLPFTLPQSVSRKRLQEQIARGLRGPLTLVTAPAGFGKTTLVASYISDCGMPVAWLSLDKDDNQVERFLNYLVAALAEADQAVGSKAIQLLAAAHPMSPEIILTSLINDLDTAEREISLVLDDYHFISNQSVHGAVAFILEHCPRSFHMVIATRSDPPLPLARLRARGQMVELRTADLRFLEFEAAQFLNDVMGLYLDAESVAALAERTEGWIAGLQMAALSMRDREDISGFIEGFAGTNRYILDYLLEEVLASQPPEIQRFLLHTSILERLTAPLCEAVLEVDKLEGWGIDKSFVTHYSNLNSCHQILEYLDRANLFLVPLDDERIWYRYHHLFADLLRAQLLVSHGEESLAELHVLASQWHEQNRLIMDAIHHASLASDGERVERLIEQNYMEMVNRGEMYWMAHWTGKLSKKLVNRRPWLCIYEAMGHGWFGQLEEADDFLAQAEKHLQGEVETPETKTMLGYVTYIKSRIAAMRGDTQQAIGMCLAALEMIPVNNTAMQLDIGMTLGYEYFLYGDFENASPSLHDTIQFSRGIGSIINHVSASCVLARLVAIQGRLHKSYDLYREVSHWMPSESGQHLGAKAVVDVGIAEVLYEWNVLDEALMHLQQGLDRMQWWGKADDFVLSYITLMRIHLAQGNRGDAKEALDKAIHIIQTRGVFSEAHSAIEAAEVKIWLAQGDFQAANRWAASQEERLNPDDPCHYETELTQIALARVYLALKKQDEAIRILYCLEEAARSSRRQGRLIEILILKALALQSMGETAEAENTFSKSLKLAEPEGYIRIFLDEGENMRLLLMNWLAHAGAGTLRDYAAHLLSHFDKEPEPPTARPEKPSPTGDLIEPLSEREREVLQLIAQGWTNKEIADELVVAPGTVKAHTSSIYRKLDVSNRTEAVARARKLGILS